MDTKHLYVAAIIDWPSRFIVGWALSETHYTLASRTGLKHHGCNGSSQCWINAVEASVNEAPASILPESKGEGQDVDVHSGVYDF